ncbi:TetR family transcriptional regulator [Streptomyces albofaciens JCM 4342]|uniref:TetR/AcrR family transcriptional regulator C-terminal domain-containing protein n=1 Tax=Streptomyces albofaciens TaxID=66866 RepID=UPI00123BA53F|nr:TetR/AcrR family transcriptional regulator C-terminal domain-containing protein [Streptomyces albofaciens]KAA6223912.1 TetR family transcriptional regulator [Streptomyces albofaciens JCM 4342]
MTDEPGADAARTLRLLWREPGSGPPRRGPRQALSIDAVIEAATALADADGLDGLTMRGVAQRLGVTPMTLYTYVPGKAALLDLMLDAAYLRMPRGAHDGMPWRARLEGVARENRALYRRHPWVAELPVSRPPLGPGVMAKYEHELAAFDGLGLDDVTADAALTYLLGFVESVARAEFRAHAAVRDSALTDEQWWATHAPVLATVFDPSRYPRAARIGSAAGQAHHSAYDPEHAFTFGLGRVLDGLAALVEPGRVPPEDGTP